MLRTMVIASAFAAVTSIAGTAHRVSGHEQAVPRCSGWFQLAACPDGTSAISPFTGQGRGGEGWAGNADGDGGPSAIPYAGKPQRSAPAG
jgi:hypothetical protein